MAKVYYNQETPIFLKVDKILLEKKNIKMKIHGAYVNFSYI
jgi:hypothetical protein